MEHIWIILTGPAGGGKTTLEKALLSHFPNSGRVLTCTTRPMRHGEEDGKSYRFFSHDQFRELLAQNLFEEHKTVHQHLYGTLRADLKEAREKYAVLVSVMDPHGALEMSSRYPEAHTIFVTASLAELAQRLQKRGESDESIATRMNTAREELQYENNFELKIVNNDLEESTNTLIRQVVFWRSAALS